MTNVLADHHQERSSEEMPLLDRGVHVAFMRHGDPYRPSQMPEDPADQARLGLLTDRGREQTRRATVDLLEEVTADVSSDAPVVVCFLGSPSPFFMGGRAHGARGMDTAAVARDTLGATTLSNGRTVELHNFVGASPRPVRQHSALSEPNYYHAEGHPHPDAYVGALAAKAAQTGVNKQDVWLDVPKDLEPMREEMGLESPAQAANRLLNLTGQLNSHSRQIRAAYAAADSPQPEVVYVAASHGDTVKALLQEKFANEPGAREALENNWYGDAGLNGVVVLEGGEDGRAKLEFAHAE